jgi:hypothetical protein
MLLPADAGGGAPIKNAAETRRAWEERGGARPTYSVSALVTGQQTRNVPITDQAPDGSMSRGQADAYGVGGGIGVHVGLLYMPLPDPTLDEGFFPAFRLGVGIDNNVLWVRRPSGYDFSSGERKVAYDNQALWLINAPIEAGVSFGFGDFRDDVTWRGAVVGVAYAPALQFSMDIAETSGDFRFNYAGFAASVDLTTLRVASAKENEAQIRFTLHFLAPIDDERPGALSAALGAAWY